MGERSATYSFAKQWTSWLEERGVKVVTVTDPSSHGHIKDEWEGTFIAAFTVRAAYTKISDGYYYDYDENDESVQLFDLESVGQEIRVPESRGQLRCQCTGRWKVVPIRRHVAKQLKQLNEKKTPGIVEQWLGITLDEWKRAKDSDVQYVKHIFPLLDMEYTRADCHAWLQRNKLPVPVKSACTFCPYHSLTAWEKMKRADDADWKQAVSVDRKIRNQRPPYPLFVHPARVPLPKAVKIPEDYGAEQLSLPGVDDVCDSGYCFL